jgi:Vault protein inter-alpha-trypsin domain
MYHLLFNKLILLILLIYSFSNCRNYEFSSRQTKGTSWWSGYVEIKSIAKRVTINPYFLDIEEDVVVAPYSTYAPANSDSTLEITGTFYLPSNTVVTGILIWDGDNILEGKLKSKQDARTEYENVVQRTVRDPILVEKTGEGVNADSYRISIYPVSYYGSRKFRIRYLCPQRFIDNRLKLQIPATFVNQVYKCPNEIPVSLKGTENINKVNLEYVIDKSETKDSLISSTTLNLPYTTTIQSSKFGDDYYQFYQYSNYSKPFIALSQNEGTNSMLVQSQFSDGLWKGNYIMYWGMPPDSLRINSGIHREIMFLWKWNFPSTFVYKENNVKYLSPYGKDVIAQAGRISSLTNVIAGGGDKTGLLLDQGEVSNNSFFPLATNGSSTFDSMSTFLRSLDSNYFYSKYDGIDPPIKIRVPENEQAAFLKKNTESFNISMKLICSVFSKNEKIIKHIVLLTAGPVPDMPNLEDYYLKSDTMLKNISISSYGSSQKYPTGYWPGVPLYKVLENHALSENGYYNQGFWIPVKKNARFEMTIANTGSAFTTKLQTTFTTKIQTSLYKPSTSSIPTTTTTTTAKNVDTCFFSGHSFSPWNKITWNAYDSMGNNLGTYCFPIQSNPIQSDTFAVKLWAGTRRPVAEGGYENNRGARFGIVDANFSLLALPNDTISLNEKFDLAETGLPFLTRNEIYFPDSNLLPVRKSLAHSLQQHCLSINLTSRGIYKIQFPNNCTILSFSIVNLQGKQLLCVNSGELKGNAPFYCSLSHFSKGVYQLVVVTSNGLLTKSFSIL